MNRYRYIIRRLLTAIPTFLGITALVYIVASLAPSSPLEILFNDPMATQEEMEEMRAMDTGKGTHDPEAPGVGENLLRAYKIHD